MKRLVDIIGAALATILTLPLIVFGMVRIYRADPGNPLFLSKRIGKGGAPFTLVKIRTMIKDASASKVDTTIEGDPRLLSAGESIRRYKADELPQFWNVLIGTMSLVGPRPNVAREVDLYTEAERKILTIKPGITDFSSLIFSDLGERLAGYDDANIAYNQLVRPWKGRLGVFYVENHTFVMDMTLLVLTVLAVFNRPRALEGVAWLLQCHGADSSLIYLAKGQLALTPLPPYGADEIVERR